MSFELPPALAHEVLDRLGVPAPADLDGMARLTSAWVAQVPFTNLAKAEALHRGAPSPEGDAEALCRRWLAAGRGGTCWSHVAALAALARHGGLEAAGSLERALWRVPPDEIDLHGGVVVRERSGAWLFDPVHASDDPLALEAGARGRHGALEVGIDEGSDGALEHWFWRPGMDAPNVYRVLSSAVDDVDVLAFVRIAEDHTGVPGGRLIWRLASPGRFVRVRRAEDGGGWEHIDHGPDGSTGACFADPADAFAAAGARDAATLGALVGELWPDGGDPETW